MSSSPQSFLQSFLGSASPRFHSSSVTRLARQLVTALGFLVLISSAHAVNRLALVIGNDAYAHVDKLRNARNDAKLMAATLKSAAFDVQYVENLDRARLWAEVDRFKNRIQKGDEVVFYFAGHGVQIGANQLLLPVDITAQNDRQVERDGVPLIDIQEALKDARTAVFVIDACRDNPFPKTGSRSIGATRGLAPPDVTSGQIVILSAGRNQRALDDVPGKTNQNGLFTHELVQVIQSGNPEIRSAFEQVKQRVDDTAKRNGHEQRPSVVSDLNGNFYFFTGNNNTVVVNPPAAPVTPQAPVLNAEAEAYQAAIAADVAEGYELYLKDFPQGRNASAIRIRLAAAKRKDLEAARQRERVVKQEADALKVQQAQAERASLATPPSSVSTPTGPNQRPNSGQVVEAYPGGPRLVALPTGDYLRGTEDETDRSDNEGPVRKVTIAHRLLMGEFEVTRGQFEQFVNESKYRTSAESTGKGCTGFSNGNWKVDPAFNWKNVGFTQDDRHPVACVSWDDVNAYIAWLNKKVGFVGAGAYRLPNESEWEYAARGVTRATDSLSANRKQHTRFHWGDDPGYQEICSYANVRDKTGKETFGNWDGVANCADRYVYTAPVGSLGGASYAKPHPFGLKDMHGNVWEWVQDCYVDSYKDDSKTPLNGDKAIETADCRRVLRGGSWNVNPGILRAANRVSIAPDSRYISIGFRLSRTLF